MTRRWQFAVILLILAGPVRADAILDAQARICLNSPEAAQYNSDVCKSFRNGVRYARQSSGAGIPGGTVSYYSRSGEFLRQTPLDLDVWQNLRTNRSQDLLESLGDTGDGGVIVVQPDVPSTVIGRPPVSKGLEILR